MFHLLIESDKGNFKNPGKTSVVLFVPWMRLLGFESEREKGEKSKKRSFMMKSDFISYCRFIGYGFKLRK